MFAFELPSGPAGLKLVIAVLGGIVVLAVVIAVITGLREEIGNVFGWLTGKRKPPEPAPPEPVVLPREVKVEVCFKCKKTAEGQSYPFWVGERFQTSAGETAYQSIQRIETHFCDNCLTWNQRFKTKLKRYAFIGLVMFINLDVWAIAMMNTFASTGPFLPHWQIALISAGLLASLVFLWRGRNKPIHAEPDRTLGETWAIHYRSDEIRQKYQPSDRPTVTIFTEAEYWAMSKRYVGLDGR